MGNHPSAPRDADQQRALQQRQQQQQQQRSRHSTYSSSASQSQQSSPAHSTMGAASSAEKLPKPRPQLQTRSESSPRSNPVSVPVRQKSLRNRGSTPQPETPEFRPSAPPRDHDDGYPAPQAVFSHPPRLPLPIEQEELVPGSPVLAARDLLDDVAGLEGEEVLGEAELHPSKSLLSQTTADDEEESVEGDAAEQDHLGGETKRSRTVPVEVTWIEPGDKVYITGTFANWSKKFRMHRDPVTGHAKTTLDLLPGMHHIRYIVDGEMRLREDNDQAVDYTNTLVNIIEVPAEPVFHAQTNDDEASDRADPGQTAGLHPPQVHPSGIDTHDHEPQSEPPKPATPGASQPGPELMDIQHKHYGQQVPTYLLDLDRDDRTARFARASSRISQIPPPPTLPGFLSKSILNGTTPMKDDSSVLNMPNHTVLNHLATSSIRNKVLATSLTTRYKRKYVTLITYRPDSLVD